MKLNLTRLILSLVSQDSMDLETELCQYFSQLEPEHSALSEFMLARSKADEALHLHSCDAALNKNQAQQNGTISCVWRL